MDLPVYLDHNATTPLAPGVLDTMTRYLRDEFGNPSSGHHYGQAPRQAVATARAQVADLLGAQPEQVVFTGCGSEANTLAISGVTTGRTGTSSPGHRPPAVLETCRALTADCARLTELPSERNIVRRFLQDLMGRGRSACRAGPGPGEQPDHATSEAIFLAAGRACCRPGWIRTC